MSNMVTEIACFLLHCIVCCLLFPGSIRLPSTWQQQAPLLFCSGPHPPPLSTLVVFSLQFTNAGTRLAQPCLAKQVTANWIFSFPTYPSVKNWVLSNAQFLHVLHIDPQGFVFNVKDQGGSLTPHRGLCFHSCLIILPRWTTVLGA